MHEEHKDEESFSADEELKLCAIREQLRFFNLHGFPYAQELAEHMLEFRCLPPLSQRVWIEAIYNSFCIALDGDANQIHMELDFIRNNLGQFISQVKWEAEEEKTPPLPRP